MVTLNSFAYIDYMDRYKSAMQFNKNKGCYIHGWYPFVEGYSRDFILSILEELPYTPTCCLDPFSGSGTTPIELQKLGIKCVSYEVNPFMHQLAVSKMRTDYTLSGFTRNVNILKDLLDNYLTDIEPCLPLPLYGTITDNGKLKKWIFHKEAIKGLLDIKYSLKQIKDSKYQNLFKIALASMLLEVSNVYRNGKCISYKDNWELIKVNRKETAGIFLDKINNVLLPDIKQLAKYKKQNNLLSNYNNCIFGSCLEKIHDLKDESVDLIITSPPYLNSRDYTDTYMIELWMLDYIKDYESLRELRKRTLKSHVQVRWDDIQSLDIYNLKKSLARLKKFESSFWNKGLLNMIKGYFADLDWLFMNLYKKMKQSGRIYFNVANSAYYGVEIETDLIVAQIAERYGFTIKEIRIARNIKPSSQQKDMISHLRETVIVMEKL